jgi:autotransporter-associated beta strand protein
MKYRRSLWLATASIAATLTLSVSQTAQAQATWNGTVDQEWNNAANWSSSPSNPTGSFTLNLATGNYPILTTNSSYAPNDVFLGNGASQTGRFDHRAGSLSQAVVGANGNWFEVGRDGGTGTYNLADTSGTGGTLTGFAQGSGSLTVGKLWVGGVFNGTAGTGTVNINTSGTINAQSTSVYSNHGGVSIIVGTSGGNGTLNLDNGTVNAAGIVDVGSSFAGSQATQGTLNISGGVLNSEGDFRTALAGSSSALSTVNLSGGTLNVGSGTKRWLVLGKFDAAKSVINVNSGNLNLNTNTDIRFTNGTGTGSHTINLNGGAITSYSNNQVTPLGAGVVDMMQTGAAATNNTFNLKGGTLTIRQVVSSTNNGFRTFNFNGGTLKATGNATGTGNSAFFHLGTGNARANVRNGGAIIDSNGFNVTSAQALLHSNIVDDNAIDGGLTKQGGGTLTLSGANTYTGKTTVTGGSLALASGSSIANSSEIALNGGNFNVSAVAGFSLGASQSLTGHNGSVTGDITVNGTLAIGNSPGTMTFNDDLTLGAASISNFEFTVGSFTLGSFDLALGGDGIQGVTFGGTLNLLFDSGETYTSGSSVKIFDFENYGSDFTTVNFSGLGEGQTAAFDALTGYVTVVPEPEAALLGGIGMLGLLRRRRK